MSESTKKPQIDFWIIGIAALIWNLMGVYFYLQQAYMTDEDLAALPQEQQALYENIPSWVTAAFAIAVFGGTLACILLLLRKKLATTIFTVSLLGIIAQNSHTFFMSDAMENIGIVSLILSAMVILIGVFLLWYSKKKETAGILI